MEFVPTFNEDTTLTDEVHGDPLAGVTVTPLRRHIPYTDRRIREMAEDEVQASYRADIRPLVVDDYARAMKVIDRGFCGGRK